MAESNPRDEEAAEEADPKKAGIPIDKLMGRIKGLMLDTEANGFLWSEPTAAPSKAEKPERDLEQGMRFSGLGDEPWKLELAIQMTWFARSADVSFGGTWPYEKLLDRLEAKGYFLPERLSIEDAVSVIEDDIRRMSPATPKKPAWHEANIEIPMHRHRTSGLMGATSRDESEGDEYVPSWLKSKTHDSELEQTVITFHDLQFAPRVLAIRLANLEAAAAGQFAQDANNLLDDVGAKEDSDNSQNRSIKAVRAALLLAQTIANEVPSRSALHVWVREAVDSRLDSSSDPQDWTPATSPLVVDAATRAGQVDPASNDFPAHCNLLAEEYLSALRSSPSTDQTGY